MIFVASELCGKVKNYDRDYVIEKLHDYSLSIRAKFILVIFGIIQADSSWSTLPNRLEFSFVFICSRLNVIKGCL